MKENLRNFFRLKVNVPIYYKRIFFDKERRKYFLADKWEKAMTIDISANGAFINITSLKKKEKILARFKIPKTDDVVYLIAEVVREESEGRGLNFILIDTFETDKIVSTFLKLEYEQHPKNSE